MLHTQAHAVRAGPLSGNLVNGGCIVSKSELILPPEAHTAVTRSSLQKDQWTGSRRGILAAALRMFLSGAWPLFHRCHAMISMSIQGLPCFNCFTFARVAALQDLCAIVCQKCSASAFCICWEESPAAASCIRSCLMMIWQCFHFLRIFFFVLSYCIYVYFCHARTRLACDRLFDTGRNDAQAYSSFKPQHSSRATSASQVQIIAAQGCQCTTYSFKC